MGTRLWPYPMGGDHWYLTLSAPFFQPVLADLTNHQCGRHPLGERRCHAVNDSGSGHSLGWAARHRQCPDGATARFLVLGGSIAAGHLACTRTQPLEFYVGPVWCVALADARGFAGALAGNRALFAADLAES